MINNSDIELSYGYKCETSISLDDVINLVFPPVNNRNPLPEFLRPNFELLLKYPEIKNIRDTSYDSLNSLILAPNTKVQGVKALLQNLETNFWFGRERNCQLMSFNTPAIG